MAGEQTSQTAAAAGANGQSSSAAASPPPSAAASPPASSSAAPSSAAPAPTTDLPKRPTWAPETTWDAEKGAWKQDAEPFFRDLLARDAAEKSRKLTLPAKPEDYKAELPADFKPPQGVEFKIKTDDPLIAQYRALAVEAGLDQATFSKGLGIIAAVRIGEKQQVEAAKAAEALKLGATAQARMDAATTWIKAQIGEDLGKEMVGFLFTAKQFEGVEALMRRFTSQGQAGYNPGGAESHTPGKLSNEDYQKLSPGERQEYARKFPQQHLNGS